MSEMKRIRISSDGQDDPDFSISMHELQDIVKDCLSKALLESEKIFQNKLFEVVNKNWRKQKSGSHSWTTEQQKWKQTLKIYLLWKS